MPFERQIEKHTSRKIIKIQAIVRFRPLFNQEIN